MVAAVIVLYHPDMSLLDSLLRSVEGQVEKVFVIDNTPGSTNDFSSHFDNYPGNISYIPLGENRGIATAQNVGISESRKAAYSHVLLMDQDSVLPPGMVIKLLEAETKLIQAGEKVAAVGPLVVEKKNGKRYGAVRHGWFHTTWISIDRSADEPVGTDYLNASGSLIRTTVFDQVGLMLEELFIDAVDTEWGLRCQSMGFRSFVAPNAIMEHSLGDTVVRAFGRDIILHNEKRNYYIVRNHTYLIRLKSMGWRWRLFDMKYVPQYIVLHSWLSRHKCRSLQSLLGALLNGIAGNLGEISEND